MKVRINTENSGTAHRRCSWIYFLAFYLWVSGGTLLSGADPKTRDDPEVVQYFKDMAAAVATYEAAHPAIGKTAVEHLKKVHHALYQYLLAHRGIWPQVPQTTSESEYQTWWKDVLKPYGLADEDWKLDNHIKISITLFDQAPLEAYKYQQPWAIILAPESVSYMIMPEGGIEKQASVPSRETLGPIDMNIGHPVKIPDEMKKAAGGQ